jgi:hypothetical protein
MSKVLVFLYKASNEDIEIAKKWVDSLEIAYSLLPIPQFRIEDHIVEKVKVITFGMAGRLAKQYVEEKNFCSVRIIELPAPKDLIKNTQNLKNRKAALDKLKQLKEELSLERFMPEKVEIKEGDLPDLDRLHLLMMQKVIENMGENTYFQTSKNGQLIEIASKPIQEADIHISFEELYTVRQILDVLGVEKVSLIKEKEEKKECQDK